MKPAWQTTDFSPPESTRQGATPIEKARGEKSLLPWKARSTCVDFASFADVIVEKIKSDEVGTAMEFRDKLRVICGSSSKKPVKDLVSGKCDFGGAFNEAEQTGGDNRPLQRIKKFRYWLVEGSTRAAVKHASASDKIKGELAYELRKIKTGVEKLLKVI